MEYSRQGNIEFFEAVLNDIILSLKSSGILLLTLSDIYCPLTEDFLYFIDFLENVYLTIPDNVESLADIYLCLAAKELLSLFNSKFVSFDASFEMLSETAKKCTEYLALAEDRVKMYELSFLIKGFLALVMGKIATRLFVSLLIFSFMM